MFLHHRRCLYQRRPFLGDIECCRRFAGAAGHFCVGRWIWDFGSSQYQTTKGSISEVLEGFQKKEGTNGIDIYKVKAWDYAGMCEVFEAGLHKVRQTHTPALFHVEEVTQPQGHSTSGSHERYKSPERLEWERDWDGIKKMKEWIIENALASEEELEDIETEAKDHVATAESCLGKISWHQSVSRWAGRWS